mgnify:CR=1 FL=1
MSAAARAASTAPSRRALQPAISAGGTASLDLMLDSMKQGGIDNPVTAQKLKDSPRLEMQGLLAGLDGRYIPPGKGNDPLRSPEALPTGRNFYSVDSRAVPTPAACRCIWW